MKPRAIVVMRPTGSVALKGEREHTKARLQMVERLDCFFEIHVKTNAHFGAIGLPAALVVLVAPLVLYLR